MLKHLLPHLSMLRLKPLHLSMLKHLLLHLLTLTLRLPHSLMLKLKRLR